MVKPSAPSRSRPSTSYADLVEADAVRGQPLGRQPAQPRSLGPADRLQRGAEPRCRSASSPRRRPACAARPQRCRSRRRRSASSGRGSGTRSPPGSSPPPARPPGRARPSHSSPPPPPSTMAGNGNSAQHRIAAVDEIRSGGEIVDNFARMSEAPVLLPRGPCVPAPGNTRRRKRQTPVVASSGWASGADGLALTAGEEYTVRSIEAGLTFQQGRGLAG